MSAAQRSAPQLSAGQRSAAQRWAALRWAALVAYVAGIFVLGLLPMPALPLPQTWLPQDKLMHAAVFGGLVVVLHLAQPRRLPPLLAALLSTALGGALELAQALVPYRAAEWLDVVADGVGALLAAGLLVLVRRLRGRPRDPQPTD